MAKSEKIQMTMVEQLHDEGDMHELITSSLNETFSQDGVIPMNQKLQNKLPNMLEYEAIRQKLQKPTWPKSVTLIITPEKDNDQRYKMYVFESVTGICVEEVSLTKREVVLMRNVTELQLEHSMIFSSRYIDPKLLSLESPALWLFLNSAKSIKRSSCCGVVSPSIVLHKPLKEVEGLEKAAAEAAETTNSNEQMNDHTTNLREYGIEHWKLRLPKSKSTSTDVMKASMESATCSAVMEMQSMQTYGNVSCAWEKLLISEESSTDRFSSRDTIRQISNVNIARSNPYKDSITSLTDFSDACSHNMKYKLRRRRKHQFQETLAQKHLRLEAQRVKFEKKKAEKAKAEIQHRQNQLALEVKRIRDRQRTSEESAGQKAKNGKSATNRRISGAAVTPPTPNEMEIVENASISAATELHIPNTAAAAAADADAAGDSLKAHASVSIEIHGSDGSYYNFNDLKVLEVNGERVEMSSKINLFVGGKSFEVDFPGTEHMDGKRLQIALPMIKQLSGEPVEMIVVDNEHVNRSTTVPRPTRTHQPTKNVATETEPLATETEHLEHLEIKKSKKPLPKCRGSFRVDGSVVFRKAPTELKYSGCDIVNRRYHEIRGLYHSSSLSSLVNKSSTSFERSTRVPSGVRNTHTKCNILRTKQAIHVNPHKLGDFYTNSYILQIMQSINTVDHPDKSDLVAFFNYAQQYKFRMYLRPDTVPRYNQQHIRMRLECYVNENNLFVGSISMPGKQLTKILLEYPNLVSQINFIEDSFYLTDIPKALIDWLKTFCSKINLRSGYNILAELKREITLKNGAPPPSKNPSFFRSAIDKILSFQNVN